jgi:hypothetical protein
VITNISSLTLWLRRKCIVFYAFLCYFWLTIDEETVMAHFPKTLVEQVQPITEDIGERGNIALARLNERGFTVARGLTPYYAGSLAVASQQKHIREYCPRDAQERFPTPEAIEKWHAKKEGRAPFLLLSDVIYKGEPIGKAVDGYAWSGTEPCDFLPDHPITTAYRLTERGLRQGLFPDFVQVATSATNTFYTDGEGIGLESWDSNKKAIGAYEYTGYELLHTGEVELRPTLNPDLPGAHRTDEGLMVPDQRQYMGYPAHLLA